MDYLQMLYETKNQIDCLCLLLNEFEECPEIILKKAYQIKPDSPFAIILKDTNYFSPNSQMSILKFQCHLFEKLVPFLVKQLKDKMIDFENDIYPGTLNIRYNGDIVGYLNIYDKIIILPRFDPIKVLETEISVMKLKKKEMQLKIQELEGYSDHITSLAKSPFKKGLIWMRRKHYRKKLVQKHELLMKQEKSVDKEIYAKQSKSEMYDKQDKIFQIIQEQLGLFFEQKYEYQVMNK